jgi:hypothetical protein
MKRLNLLGALGVMLTLGLLASAYRFHEQQSNNFDNKPAAPLPYPSKAPAFGTLSIRSNFLALDGKPLFLNGDAAWSLLVVPSEQDAYEYLRIRREQGFNSVLVNLIEHYVGGPRNQNGDLPFVGNQDFKQPNEAYFKHADRVLAEASRLGMIVLLAPAYLGYECGVEGWCETMRKASVQDLQRYGEYVGRRYSQFRNVIWVHGGDADARRFDIMEKVSSVNNGIRLAGGRQLQTAHCARNHSGNECYAELQLDFDTAYASCTTTDSVMANIYASKTNASIHSRPFVYIEGTYENMKESPFCIGDQFLRAMIGGASGHVFGNQPVWDFGNNWKQNLDSPGSRTIRVLWRALAPTRSGKWSVLKDPGFGENHNFVALFSENTHSSILFYIRQKQIIDPALMTHKVTMRSCWLDLRKLDKNIRSDSFTPANATKGSMYCFDVKPGHAPKPPHTSDWLVLAIPRIGSSQHPWSHF